MRPEGVSIIDGQQLDRVFDALGTAPSSFKVVLQGLTVRNGTASLSGGIQVGNADLVVRDCAVTGNRATVQGGGVSNAEVSGSGNVTLVRTTVARNVSSSGGGGFFVVGNSMLTVKDSVVRHNVSGGPGGGICTTTAILIDSTVSANETRGGSGGGGIKASTVTLTNSTVSGNSAAGVGGGINAGTVTLTNNTVSGNIVSGAGGGIFAPTATLTKSTIKGNVAGSVGGGITADTATLTNCTISGNLAATDGGGIHANTAKLTNCTISGNIAASNGGGLHAAEATLLNCTVAENSAHIGGGLFRNAGGTFSVRNTIVALNLVDFTGTGPDVSGAFTSQGHNLIGDGTGGTGFTNGVNGDIVGTGTNAIDPKLGPLANNGGPTKTHALLAGSPAIDHGDNTILPATDQRGFARKKDGNFDGLAIVDIGAFEK
jgi:predicted outer membrane repeat protein